MIEEELRRLRQPWLKEMFGRLQLRPKRYKKKVLLAALALLTILSFSVWWYNPSPRQLPPLLNQGQSSGSGTVQANSPAVLDSELQQEQTAMVVQKPSEPLRGAPESEPAARNAQAPQSYASTAGGSPTSEKRVSPLSDNDQQVLGQSSVPPLYVLRAEALATTWLHLVIDESKELEYLLQPNEEHTWRAKSGFSLHIGNAAGLLLYLNDQPLKPLGESGEVVLIELPDPSLIVTSSSEYTEPASRP